jgi:hypothetical protein
MKYVVQYKTVHTDMIGLLQTDLLSILPFEPNPPQEPANAIHQPSAA